ncbi:uncharacterized protein LOC117116731 [Anneissia japonica]|uniref:uncharacterized protein LOC117116731 n=1 Tax=Anneissia japonica TaxID=1529436 RepID=UPI001425A84F|nr:uncharacterized protein LOC117116731 [Anneissia japonica]
MVNRRTEDSAIESIKNQSSFTKIHEHPQIRINGSYVRATTYYIDCNRIELRYKEVTFWRDSMDVLWWVRGRSRSFKPFVANRIGEIQQKTNPNQWRHVPTKSNPADVASRGTTVESLKVNKMWWNGPEFLMECEERWPVNKIEQGGSVTEQRKYVRSFLNQVGPLNIDDDWRLDPKRYSSWSRLIRIAAYVHRFITNCRSNKNYRVYRRLEHKEIQYAELSIIRKAQQESFPSDIRNLKENGIVGSNSVLSTLTPTVDEDGVLRMTGRLSLVEALPHDVRYPIILPRKHPVTELIVKKYHDLGKHVAGTNHILSLLSERYWIIHNREEIPRL